MAFNLIKILADLYNGTDQYYRIENIDLSKSPAEQYSCLIWSGTEPVPALSYLETQYLTYARTNKHAELDELYAYKLANACIIFNDMCFKIDYLFRLFSVGGAIGTDKPCTAVDTDGLPRILAKSDLENISNIITDCQNAYAANAAALHTTIENAADPDIVNIDTGFPIDPYISI